VQNGLVGYVPSNVIPLYWVAFLVAVGEPWLGLCYSAAISYLLGIFILWGYIKNRKLPVLNQGQRDLAIAMSRNRQQRQRYGTS